VRNGVVDYSGAPKISGEVLARIQVGFAEPGDVLFTHKGTIGRVAVNTEPCVLTPQTTYYRIHTDVFDQRYLMFLLGSPFYFAQYSEVMSQTTRNYVPITEQYKLFLLVPPLAEQVQIGSRVNDLLARLGVLEECCKRASTDLKSLHRAVLSKAFRGEMFHKRFGKGPSQCPSHGNLR